MPHRFRHACNNHTFSCNLESQRCPIISQSTGNQCRRRSYLPYEACWQHIRTVGFNVSRRTTLVDPVSGDVYPFRGLFAFHDRDGRRDRAVLWDEMTEQQQLDTNLTPQQYERVVFDEGYPIFTTYTSKLITNAEHTTRYSTCTGPYAITGQWSGRNILDAACRRGVLAYANAPTPGTQPNAQLETVVNGQGRKVYAVALRNIFAGEEILVQYGDDYAFDGTHSTVYQRP